MKTINLTEYTAVLSEEDPFAEIVQDDGSTVELAKEREAVERLAKMASDHIDAITHSILSGQQLLKRR